MTTLADPHFGQPVLVSGAPLDGADGAAVLLHGRGARADDMLALAAAIDRPRIACLAPQAAGLSWYPVRFLAPLEHNEPWLSSALAAVTRAIQAVASAGIPLERTVLLGFSQGACLALEYAARHAARYGGLAGLSGALIGPPGTPRDYLRPFEGTPVFLGCSDVDPHVPAWRVLETAQVFETWQARVSTRLYPDLGHTVCEDEIVELRALFDAFAPRAR